MIRFPFAGARRYRIRSIAVWIAVVHVAAALGVLLALPIATSSILQHAVAARQKDELRERAAEIARDLSITPTGTMRLALSQPMAALYSGDYGAAYAVIDDDGRVLFSSLPGRQAISKIRLTGSSIELFKVNFVPAILGSHVSAAKMTFLSHTAPAGGYGAAVKFNFNGRPILVQVVDDVFDRDAVTGKVLAHFPFWVSWIAAPLLLLLLLADIVALRRAMRPIMTAARTAKRIGPDHPEIKLPEAEMPAEVLPLVGAVNRGLDRLAAGFRAQREFTADAAHELRTPLAILRTQIDLIRDRHIAEPLRRDVESMARLLDQLLEISELDSLAIGDSERADLATVVVDVATLLMPLSLAQDKALAVTGASQPVRVRGNQDAIARAVRNLAENALAHTPPGSTVELAVDKEGVIRVLDRGPGLPKWEREHIFERFWRGHRRRDGHAGLGLAIVARIVEMHGAVITVEDRPGGGAAFAIRFPAVLREPENAASELMPAK